MAAAAAAAICSAARCVEVQVGICNAVETCAVVEIPMRAPLLHMGIFEVAVEGTRREIFATISATTPCKEVITCALMMVEAECVAVTGAAKTFPELRCDPAAGAVWTGQTRLATADPI